MATFDVKYRNKSGAMANDLFEADSRTDLFDRLRAQGIQPVSVQEVASRNAKPKRGDKRERPSAGLAIGFVALAVAVSLYLWLTRDSVQESVPQASTRTNVVKAAASQIREERTPATTNAVKVASKEESVENDLGLWMGKKIKARQTNTNGTFVVTTLTTEDGRTHKIMNSLEKPTFDNASDQLLALATSATPAGSPPLPGMSEKQLDESFRKSLETPIVIKEEDDEKVRQMKECVIQARKEMLEMLKTGQSVKGVLEEHQKLMNENVKMRNECLASYRKLMADGETDVANQYLEKVNAALEEMGIMKIVPKNRSSNKVAPLQGGGKE